MQSKLHSFIEALSSTAVGFVINVTAQHLIFPLFGIFIPFSQNLMIAVIFTVISVIRSYVIRRFFNNQFYTFAEYVIKRIYHEKK